MPTAYPGGVDEWFDWCESAEGAGLDMPVVAWGGDVVAVGPTWPVTQNYYYTTTTTSNNITWTSSSGTLNGGAVGGWVPLGYIGAGGMTASSATYGLATRVTPTPPEPPEAVQARATARTRAADRAEEFLVSMLSDRQKESYRLNGEFEVMGSAGNLYRIKRGKSGNIEWIKPDGKVGGKLCAHPHEGRAWLPTPDVMLAQMLALTTDEPSFIRIANVHRGNRPPIRV